MTQTTTFNLNDNTGLTSKTASAWVCGWINGESNNFQVLQSNGTFGPVATNQLSIQANKPWQKSGITITKGSVVTLSFKKGQWTADPATNNGKEYGPNGCAGLDVPSDKTSFPMPGQFMGALVGRIGETGAPFLVGAGPTYTPGQQSGELELCINDDLTGKYGAGLTDNSGSITMEIQSIPFYQVSSIPSITLTTKTNGNDHLLFVIAPSQPFALPVNNNTPIGYTSYPYANPPGIEAPGPFDIFEFGENANDDLSAVNGFGINLSFEYDQVKYGANSLYSRKQIGSAYKAFIKNEGTSANDFTELLYNKSIGHKAPTPPLIDGQYFAIADPGDMLQAKQIQGQASEDPLAAYWDDTLEKFFKIGNSLSINLSANPSAPNIYSGQSTQQTNPLTNVSSPAFTLTNSTTNISYIFFKPPKGYQGAQYVFQQSFNNDTPAGSGGDAGLLQDNIWQALCRGVALSGINTQPITAGESTTAWNDPSQWYQPGNTYDVYAKFLHYATIDGKDSRIKGSGDPVFYNNAAYGFSEDENPDGPYTGPNIPSKTPQKVRPGSTLTITVGPWA